MNTTTATTKHHHLTLNEGYFARRSWGDWLFALLVVVGGLFAFQRYQASMDVLRKGHPAGAPCRR
jgi:hypothetical protein